MSWRRHCPFYRGLRAGFLTGLLLLLAPFLYLGGTGEEESAGGSFHGEPRDWGAEGRRRELRR